MKCEFKRLAELSIDGKGHYGIAAPAVKYSKKLPTYLRITDINDDGTINVDGLMSVNDPNAQNFFLKPNDIVFARTGASTGRNYFYDGTKGKFVYAGFLIKFSIDESKVNPKYIKYYCMSQTYKNWVNSFSTGSTRENINAQTYANMPVLVPGRKQQDFLVKILSALDDKIECNNQINKNLEEQAQALFKKFFIDIDLIPDGWSKGCLLDIADYLNGLAMQKFRPSERDIGLPVLKIKELRQGMCDDSSEKCSSSIKDEYIVHDGDVIFSWSGSLLVDFWCGGTCGLNQHLFKVTSKNYDKWFYYFWTLYHLGRFSAIASAKATTMGHIKREDLMNAEVFLPSKKDYKKIDILLKPIVNLIIKNRIENRKLAQLRDTLLPKLMSGELDVSDIDI